MPDMSPRTAPLGAQPRVAGNDWRSLRPPVLGEWQPTRSVSVVVPAYEAAGTLPFTLGSLALQTYPSSLLEVVVVDDGSTPPLVLPELRPENTRIVRAGDSWGCAHASQVGASATEGEVIHWLDADMMLHRDHVEAQLRWHHLIDHAAVLGHKRFVDLGDARPDLHATLELIREGRADELFADRWTATHEWVEEHIGRTEGLTRNPTMSFLVHVGATASVDRGLYLASGGMDEALKLGEDIELGYRLAQQGAVFVPDDEAGSWHLGRSHLMRTQEAVNRYNRPFVTDRVPSLRKWRTKGRSYTVPWVEAVVDASAGTYEEVRHTVNGALTGSVADVHVVVVGPWSRLDDRRRSPLADPDRDLRMLRAEFTGDARVRWVEQPPADAFPATYRLLLPAGWAPGRDSLRRLGVEMARRDQGLVSLVLPDGRVARLERTSAFSRARRLDAGAAGSDLDDVVDDVSGTWWYDGVEEGFIHVDAPAPERPEKAPADAVGGGGRPPQRGAAQQRALAGPEVGSPDPVDAPSGVRDRLARSRLGRIRKNP
jgi:glycosyltransferase involved in cell wall biosynthesis